ncbi:MAG: phenylpropionate dioxygenase [Sphingomonadales bacterium]|nr:MAG: phenylpropionate dioxygenase [Sphingomonadales bacterium]TNF03468.1 MAG: phenylpropionate dioxygenase [Sphingomonadales bacterium]
MTVTKQDLVDFVYAEARMLDERRFEEWLTLFAEDGIYWMPLHHDEPNPKLVTTLFHEDLLLLKTRVLRLMGERTFSQQPASRCHHLLQAPMVDRFDPDAGEFSTWASFLYTETRADEKLFYTGWVMHDLVLIGGELRIKQKKVQLIDCDAPHRNLQLFM